MYNFYENPIKPRGGSGVEYCYRALDIIDGKYDDILNKIPKEDIALIKAVSFNAYDIFETVSIEDIKLIKSEKVMEAFNKLSTTIKGKSTIISLIKSCKKNITKAELNKAATNDNLKKTITKIIDSDILKLGKNNIINFYDSKFYTMSYESMKLIKETKIYEFIHAIPLIVKDKFKGAYYEFERFYFSHIGFRIETFNHSSFKHIIHTMCDNISKAFTTRDTTLIFKSMGRLISLVHRFMDKIIKGFQDEVFTILILKEASTNKGAYIHITDDKIYDKNDKAVEKMLDKEINIQLNIIGNLKSSESKIKREEKRLNKILKLEPEDPKEVKIKSKTKKTVQENIDPATAEKMLVEVKERKKEIKEKLKFNNNIKDDLLDKKMPIIIKKRRQEVSLKFGKDITIPNIVKKSIVIDHPSDFENCITSCPHCHISNTAKEIENFEVVYDYSLRCPYCGRIVLTKNYN